VKKLAAAAIAVCLPFAALAQTPPPLELAPTVTASAAPDSPLDLGRYPSARRDEIWERYARKNQVSVNVLYPVGGAILLGVASSFWGSFGDGSAMGAISLPVEYERSMNRNLSLFGVVQPTFATGQGSSAFSCAVGAGTRLYFTGNAPQGFWTGLEVDHALGSQAFTMRAEAGTNTVFDNGLSVSFGGGLGLTWAGDVVNPATGLNINFFPAAGLRFSIGYLFV
jgi:hypothetical protein